MSAQLTLLSAFKGEKEVAAQPQPKKPGRPPKWKVKEEIESPDEKKGLAGLLSG